MVLLLLLRLSTVHHCTVVYGTVQLCMLFSLITIHMEIFEGVLISCFQNSTIFIVIRTLKNMPVTLCTRKFQPLNITNCMVCVDVTVFVVELRLLTVATIAPRTQVSEYIIQCFKNGMFHKVS